ICPSGSSSRCSCSSCWRRPASSALRALAVDAGNDTLLSLLSLGAFVPGQWAGARADVWLSLPVALWIGYAGVQLARETVQRLMGAAGSGAQHAALRQAVLATPGVRSVPRLDAYHHGNQLAVRVQVALDAALPVAEACRIVDAVRAMLAALPEVAQVSVECAVFRET
ncbi:MAG: cation diffusion facilitator family transporter, partial [Polyangiales bacterium]